MGFKSRESRSFLSPPLPKPGSWSFQNGRRSFSMSSGVSRRCVRLNWHWASVCRAWTVPTIHLASGHCILTCSGPQLEVLMCTPVAVLGASFPWHSCFLAAFLLWRGCSSFSSMMSSERWGGWARGSVGHCVLGELLEFWEKAPQFSLNEDSPPALSLETFEVAGTCQSVTSLIIKSMSCREQIRGLSPDLTPSWTVLLCWDVQGLPGAFDEWRPKKSLPDWSGWQLNSHHPLPLCPGTVGVNSLWTGVGLPWRRCGGVGIDPGNLWQPGLQSCCTQHQPLHLLPNPPSKPTLDRQPSGTLTQPPSPHAGTKQGTSLRHAGMSVSSLFYIFSISKVSRDLSVYPNLIPIYVELILYNFMCSIRT